MSIPIDYEATGPNYAVDKLLDVRERVHQAIAAVSAKIAPGMAEEDAVAMARGKLIMRTSSIGTLTLAAQAGENPERAKAVARRAMRRMAQILFDAARETRPWA